MHIDSLILTGKRRILPRFGLTLGFTLLYLSLVVLIPVSATFAKASGLGWVAFAQAVTTPRVLASFRLSFVTALYAAAINAVMGVIVAWVLVRYRFPGRADIGRDRRSSVRPADRGRRHRADGSLFRKRLARPPDFCRDRK